MVENSPCIFDSSVRVSGPVVAPAFWLPYIMPQWKLTRTFIGVSLQLSWVYRPPTPFFFKVCFTPINFYKRPPYSICFHSNERSWKKSFTFLGKGEKQSVERVSCSCCAGSGHPSSERGPPHRLPVPRTALSVSPSDRWGFELCLNTWAWFLLILCIWEQHVS